MQVTLKPASRAQEIEARTLRSVEWARWLSHDGYLRKLEVWDMLEHASGGKLVTWVLVPTEDPESLNILSTCSTYRRNILVLPPNEIKSTTSTGYAIASVFTPPQFRGKGYATRMMGLLHFAIAQSSGVPAFPTGWGQPPKRAELPGMVSVLYSGVGTFYSGCPPGEGTGWTIVGTKTTHWIVAEINISATDSKVETLSQEAAVSAVVADTPLFKRDFESKGPSSRIHFAFQPTAAWCLFQMRNHLDHPDYAASPPTTWGARIQAEDGETHFIVWTYKPYPESQRKLVVVNLRASLATFPHLFIAMASVARDEGHHIIEAWDLDEALESAVHSTGGRAVEREGQLPAMKWYGSGEEVVWAGNNKQATLVLSLEK
ncbi:hypothetical protein FRC06_000422 [Ceratobasidium sp. 370]|nr:hypothetical protein FRC06_000422 [Ceratobasidium sp. 370]